MSPRRPTGLRRGAKAAANRLRGAVRRPEATADDGYEQDHEHPEDGYAADDGVEDWDDDPAPAVLRPVGPHFVIAAPAPGPDGGADELAEALAPVPAAAATLIVVAAAPDAPTVLRAELAALAGTATTRGAAALLIAASGLATATADGRRPAQRMAERAGLPVIAPDGLVAIEPDGTLRVRPAQPGGQASWWHCPPDGSPWSLGAAWPAAGVGAAPATTPATPPAAAPAATPTAPMAPMAPVPALAPAVPPPATPLPAARPGECAVTELPAGYWFRARAAADTPMPAAFPLAASGPGALVLLVGSPEAPTLPAADLAEAAAGLPRTGDLLISAPWAPPSDLLAMACGVADRLGRTVRAAIGLPLRAPDGRPAPRVLDRDGNPTWQPFLTELTAVVGHRRVVSSGWLACPAGWHSPGPALFSALPGWLLEAVPAGLWLRPEDRPHDQAPRLLAPDPLRPLLVVGDRERPITEEVWERLGELVTDLPEHGGRPFGLLAHAPADPSVAAVARFVARLQGLEWLGFTPDGGAPVTPVAAPAPAPAAVPEPAAAPVPVPVTMAEPVAAPEPVPVTMAEPVAVPEPLPVPVQPPAPVETPPPAPAPEPQPAPEPEPTPEPLPTPAPEPTPAPTPEPAPTPATSAPVTSTPTPLTPAALVPLPRVSPPAAREAVKELLGDQYLRIASKADHLAARLPALRSTPQDDVKPDLVAVLLHHTDGGLPASRAELAAAARSARSGPLTAFLTCLGSGLRRLPSHHGAVLLGAPVSEAELAAYVPGSVLAEPAAVAGVTSPAVVLGTPVEFAVWSATGRRTTLFGGPSDEAEVVFAPGTCFTVLDVLPGDGADRPTRVLLRESDPTATPDSSDSDRNHHPERDRTARERLTAWLDRRDALDPAERRRHPRPERYHLTPGVTTHP
ncbi:hypothetical protein [Kitasatospora sp. LaBMicrA B282]|uniref:hypothetical protein n=1 Tax=Kitasatospora sp. LaBMicrA B282 TaxID=3420949 RepID=UPI003D0F1C1F